VGWVRAPAAGCRLPPRRGRSGVLSQKAAAVTQRRSRGTSPTGGCDSPELPAPLLALGTSVQAGFVLTPRVYSPFPTSTGTPEDGCSPAGCSAPQTSAGNPLTPPPPAVFSLPQPRRLLCDHLPEHLQPPGRLLQGDEQGGGKVAPQGTSPLTPLPSLVAIPRSSGYASASCPPRILAALRLIY